MTRSPEREDSDQGFGVPREVDLHRVSGIVIARRDIEYAALRGMIATIPGLSCLGVDDAQQLRDRRLVVVIVDPAVDWVRDQVIWWHRRGSVLVVVDSGEGAVVTTLQEAGATAVLSYQEATTAKILALIAHVMGTRNIAPDAPPGSPHWDPEVSMFCCPWNHHQKEGNP